MDDLATAAESWRQQQALDLVLSLIALQWSLKTFGRSSKHPVDAYSEWSSRVGASGQITGSGETTARDAAKVYLSPSEYQLYCQYERIRPQMLHRHGLLFRVKTINGREVWQVLLPSDLKTRVMRAAHDSMGHMGRDRTFALLEDRLFWPGMRRDVEKYVASCARCLRFKAKTDRAPLQTIEATSPLELVHLDFLKVEDNHDNYHPVLVITDHFSGFAAAVKSSSESAHQTAKLFLDNWCCVYGFPDTILTDQGRNFESRMIREMCQLLKIRKLRTTPYHPQSNGQVERFNSTLLSMIGTLEREKKTRWPQLLKLLTLCYNGSRHRVTGVSPHFLMFGWEPRLPIDWELGLPMPGSWLPGSSKVDFVNRLRKQLQWASRVAQRARHLEKIRSTERYDSRVKGASLSVGDLCLVRVTQFNTKYKVADRWSEDMYEVIERKSPLVYVVRPV